MLDTTVTGTDFFDNPVSLIFRCILDPNVVGATHRGEPIPAAGFHVQRQMREHLASFGR
mgnify:CR=1 FL=1